MQREYHRWFSWRLNRDMEMLVFGHAGAPVLAFPTSQGRFYEYEDFGMVDALAHHIEQGWIQLFCADGVDAESWYNRGIHPHDRAVRHNQYESYLMEEVVPLMRGHNSADFLMATGCSFGAYHAANLAFKHPEVFSRVIAISGQYDLHFLLHGYFDEDCYFNSPISYIPNLADERNLGPLRNHLQIILCSGGWSDICHDGTQALSAVLRAKDIPHTLDIWDDAWHDWPWWRQMTLKHV
jgi:esterase/lipase superfamily enzyme